MGEQTGIAWCQSTFNHVRGCTKISEGCTYCYADRDSKRNPAVLGVWGPRGTRVLASEDMWKKPLKWDAAAARSGERHLVFCASLADVFEQWDGPIVNSTGYPICAVGRQMTMDDVRLRLFDLIRQTPNLCWLLLTKRIDEVMGTLSRCSKLCSGRQVVDGLQTWLVNWYYGGHPPENVWLGTSVENQEWADKRVPELLKIPAKLRWLSVEPQLGPVDLTPWLGGIDWTIVGGESGGKARPFDLAWARSIIKQCRDTDVVPFVKQLGANCHGYWLNPDGPGDGICHHSPDRGWRLKHPAGADPSEWPHDLRVQETPS